MRRALIPACVTLFASAVAGACSSSDGGTKVAVTGTDTSCTMVTEDIPAGKLAVEFTNRAGDVNELYVLREDGSVVAEVEGVTTGTSRTLNVDLVAGEYQVRCKPGQTGAGITSDFTVTGEGGTAPKAANRSKSFRAVDFDYESLDLSDVTAGETIRFEMRNAGTQPHELELLGPDGEAVGEVASTEAGEDGAATISFEAPGEYTYRCILVDPKTGKRHTDLGMAGTFEVAAR